MFGTITAGCSASEAQQNTVAFALAVHALREVAYAELVRAAPNEARNLQAHCHLGLRIRVDAQWHECRRRDRRVHCTVNCVSASSDVLGVHIVMKAQHDDR